ncbi:hypothetical protein U9M48_030615 [Paspalum notatum var. saurae]|uniref:ATP-dependent DNA helicase n=1 Tax=Paspalum notatum var. saurae TaxID=547442 RepID=A0AAQ3X2D1_PASNO
MLEDYCRTRLSMQAVQNMVLIDIRNMLQSMGKDIKSYPLPEIDEEHDSSHGVDREIYEESIIEVDPNHETLVASLNAEQRSAYDEILAAGDSGKGVVFFIDGLGGTGKTFLYKALLATVRGMDNISVVIATSGVAASIMPGGRTAHSRFKIPLTIYGEDTDLHRLPMLDDDMTDQEPSCPRANGTEIRSVVETVGDPADSPIRCHHDCD